MKVFRDLWVQFFFFPRCRRRVAGGIGTDVILEWAGYMKIAQVAPLYESCPPKLYGGTERVVSYLTEALVGAGHEVTLFASGDSETGAELHAVCPQALRLVDGYDSSLAYHVVQMNRVMAQADDFDVIHFHTDYLHFPFFSDDLPVRTVTTLHGRLDLPELPLVYSEFPSQALVSVSDHQRRPLPWLNWRSTVYHGLPAENFTMGAGAGGYLAFLGRICPEKRPDRAIDIARRVGLPLKIAAKVDRADTVYFEEIIRPLLRDPLIEYIGEIDETEKNRFLGDASAMLFPIDWPEPFGLTMIEAMACGTPVIAYRHGSAPEVVDDGITGFLVDGRQEAVDMMAATLSLDRKIVRTRFEQRFTVERMMRDYLNVYRALAEEMPFAMDPAMIASPAEVLPPPSAA